MEKIYVSLGADCGGAGALKKAGKKTFSFPYDWLVCFHSAHLAFKNDFKGFLEDRVMNTELNCSANEFNLEYNVRFFHRELIKDYDNTLQRRINRLLGVLKSSDKEVNFLRRSHDYKHHAEMRMFGLDAPNEIDEVQDMKMLRDILIEKYPNLKFKINLFLWCPHCNKGQKNYQDEHLNIFVSTQMHMKDQPEEEFWDWVKTL